MTQFNNDPSDGQCLPDHENLPVPNGDDTPIMSLTGVADLLSAMESELAVLPSPYPLFAKELASGILEQLRVSK